MTEMSDTAAALKLNEWLKAGETARDNGTDAPHNMTSVQRVMHSYGWLKRDLQLALCRSDMQYRNFQLSAGRVTQELLDRQCI